MAQVSKSRAFLARAVLGALALSASIAGGGCATERDPINQVQVGVLPKSFFIGKDFTSAADDPEFYFKTTVVDVAAGAGAEGLFTNSDSQPTVRVRWEITEHEILARLSYELVDGTDGKGLLGPPRADDPRAATPAEKAPSRTTTDGQIVAAFDIVKHFDIRRDYNQQTGEEMNTIVENDRDRPWHDREFIRVDWSKNRVTSAYDLDATSQLGLYGGVKWEPLAYHVNDPAHADAPVMDIERGYFDVTNKAFAAPQLIEDPEWGDFPACLLTGAFPQTSCNTSEVKLRLSFRKVTPTDYEPLEYDGRKMELFGFFTNDRFGYDRKYGVVDDKWHRFASRWNVWQRSHVDGPVVCATAETTPVGADPHRDTNGDGTEDECASVGRGSRCDEAVHACTIPLRDRLVRTVVWHVNRGFPEELFEDSKKVVEKWSDAMRVGIVAGRLAECRRTKEKGCEAQVGWPSRWADDWAPPVPESYPTATEPGALASTETPSPADVPRVMVLCHNPVDPTKDDPICGKEPVSPRLGDLRYNLFSLIDSPQVQRPWGIMMDAEDPLSGEKLSGSVNQWGATLDRAAAQLSDVVSLLNGETSPEQFIAGKDVSDWVKGVRASAGGGGAMSAAELAGRQGAFDPKAMTPLATGKPGARKQGPARARFRARMNELESAGKLSAGNTALAERIRRLRGGEIEAKMVTPELTQAAGFDPKSAPTRQSIDMASPLSRMSPAVRRSLEHRALVGRAKRHSCKREAPEVDHVLGLARQAQRLFGTVDLNSPGAVQAKREKVYQWARRQFSAGVFSHELGHSVGLRHNFAGTFDSLNYDNAYWQLRTKNGTVTRPCAIGTTNGADCVGPRYNDPLTQEEIDGPINAFATSSVMDYPGDQTLDMFLLGKYDRAAVRFGYGGVVDVWNAPGWSVTGSGDGQRKAYAASALAESPGLFGVYSFPQPGSSEPRYIHYSQYQNELGLIGECAADTNSPIGSTCKGAPLDVVDYRDMAGFAADPKYASIATVPAAVDASGRVRRGYMFSSDEYADSGNVPAFSYDAGADAYEQIRFLESAYENRYVLDSFRRGRTSFNSWDVTARAQGHYLDAIQLIAKTYAFAMVLEVDDPTRPPPGLVVDGNYGPLAVGSTVALDLFARSLLRPEPGVYCSTASDQCPGTQPYGLESYLHVADSVPTPQETPYDFKLPLGAARFIHNDFDYSQGYWWSDYQTQVGSFYDKVWSIYYLTEAFDSFISNSKEDFVDGRYKNVNFATVYPEQIRRLFASIYAGDLDVLAPWATYAPGPTPTAEITYPEWHKLAPGTRPATAKLIDPALGFNEQLYAMVWSALFLPSSWSYDFIHDARITALAGEQISWPAADTYTFVDPATSITYRARSTGTEAIFGFTREKSLGARVLEWANNLVYEAYIVETDAQGYYLLNADGTPKLKLDAKGKAQLNPDFPGGDQALKRYVQNVEILRQLVSTYVRPLDTLPGQ